jgi:hypothetical protein
VEIVAHGESDEMNHEIEKAPFRADAVECGLGLSGLLDVERQDQLGLQLLSECGRTKRSDFSLR